MRYFVNITLFFIVILIGGCGLTSPDKFKSVSDRNIIAVNIAKEAGLHPVGIQTKLFGIVSFQLDSIKDDTIYIYIEGDGYSWSSSNNPSDDPTPIIPFALYLASKDYHQNMVYLARPCQYLGLDLNLKSNCTSNYWTKDRFSIPIIESMSEAIDGIKSKFHSKSIVLIGYSGGGALALLIAAKRSDIQKVVTVSGNLNVRGWEKEFRIDKLSGSEDPMDYRDRLKGINQLHLIAENDQIVPKNLSYEFINSMDKSPYIEVMIYPDFDHNCCWVDNWKDLQKLFH